MGVQELIVIILIVCSLAYLAFKLIKKTKNHDCDNCGYHS